MGKLQDFDYSNVHFVSDQEREYFAEAHLGEQVREFLQSPVGRYLHGRAKADIDEGKDKLADIDPRTSEGIAEWKQVKQDMANAEAFMRYLADAINHGDMAAQLLEEYRE